MDRINNNLALVDLEDVDYSSALTEDNIVVIERDVKSFRKYLTRDNRSEQTVMSYCRVMNKYFHRYRTINKTNLMRWKNWLVSLYSPQTVNVNINAMNKYLKFINKKGYSISTVKVQTKPFLENVISFDDYKYFIKKLKESGDIDTYILVKYIACTGARVSEVVQFRVEHVEKGYMQLLSKGGKVRRIYIPQRLQKETLAWLNKKGIDYGPLFLDSSGTQLKASGVNYRLKKAAKKYPKIPMETIYPHSFRHMYAKAFLSKNYDLMLLADLLGHSSLEITRIYTRMTAAEQVEIVNRIVTW